MRGKESQEAKKRGQKDERDPEGQQGSGKGEGVDGGEESFQILLMVSSK